MKFIWDREHFYCEYCQTHSFLGEPADGVKVLGEESCVRCPACQENLKIASVARARVLYCSRCRGILVEQERFRKLVKYLRARAAGPPDTPTAIDRQELRRRLQCPRCDRVMDVHPYYGPGNIIIDTCMSCRVIWLDYGELRKVRDAPGRDRGQSSRVG
jgi:Zn-finger nucleic acid-binding protein